MEADKDEKIREEIMKLNLLLKVLKNKVKLMKTYSLQKADSAHSVVQNVKEQLKLAG